MNTGSPKTTGVKTLIRVPDRRTNETIVIDMMVIDMKEGEGNAIIGTIPKEGMNLVKGVARSKGTAMEVIVDAE